MENIPCEGDGGPAQALHALTNPPEVNAWGDLLGTRQLTCNLATALYVPAGSGPCILTAKSGAMSQSPLHL